jgi:curved DNA-binding protein CbpA
MDTLYDLLGALPRDDAEGLRAAFRQAVKGAHPDLNPGDPDAAVKFREIVRANEILSDPAQRAAYDHLLNLARCEQEQATQHALAGRIHRLASGVMVLAAVVALGISAYLLFLHLSFGAARLASTADVVAHEPVAVTAAIAQQPSPPAVPVTATDEAAAHVGPPLDITPGGARAYWALGTAAYRNGDLNGALADFDQAIQLDPKFASAYIDRGVVLYRMHQFERAFADISHARRLTRAAHTTAAKKKPQVASNTAATPAPPRRTAQLSWQTAFPSLIRER